MKGFLRTSAILLLCAAFLTSAQKKESKEERDDEEDSSSKSSSRYPARELGGSGRCSCRAQREEIETLELRLDRMIETWNDFVDKNRGSSNDGPIRRPPGSGGFGSRPPPYGHGPGQSPGRSDRPRYPFNRGMEDDDRSGGGRNAPPRRFQF